MPVLMTSNRRFSKLKVGEYLMKRIEYMRRQWKFDDGNGWAQVQGRGEEANRAYGEYSALKSIMSEFEL